MKLSPLLTQYLYSHHRLDLPGIGSFLMDPNAITEPEGGRPSRNVIPGTISFESNPSIRESAALISFISTQANKMKALAAADLDSYLELAQQFLNIGKPFLIEGIGTVSKKRSGEYDFTPDAISAGKMKEVQVKESSKVVAEETFSGYQQLVGTEKPAASPMKKPAIALLILVSTGLAVWGGYTIYKKSAPAKQMAMAAADTNQPPENNSIPQVSTPAVNTDTSVAPATQIATPPPPPPVAMNNTGSLKFVLENANKARAFQRYAKLKTFQWNVQMETSDSIQYKLFLVIPGGPSDTSRIIDSLTALNGKKVHVE